MWNFISKLCLFFFFCLFVFGVKVNASGTFSATWDTTKISEDSSDSFSIKLPLTAVSYVVVASNTYIVI